MTDFSSILLSYGILLSGLLVTVGVMYVLLKHRDATVKLPVDREQLTRIPAYGLQALGYQVFQYVQTECQALLLTERVSQWLTKATGTPVTSTPVLVFPGWHVTCQTKPPFPVVNHKQLVGTIPTLRTQALTQQQVDTIIYQVAQRCISKSEVGKVMGMKRFTLLYFITQLIIKKMEMYAKFNFIKNENKNEKN